MKLLFVTLLATFSAMSYAQDKYNFVHFNKLTEVTGTEYVIASIENVGKMFETRQKYLLFINTLSGQTRQVDFPSDGWIEKMEQVRNDSLGLNRVVVCAQTVNLNGKRGIDWEDPKQIIVLSPGGDEKVQLTNDRLFVRTWAVNNTTGTIVITGHYDTNNNNKYDKTDKSEILIYDLKTLKLVSKI
jgi:hypothetical protein